VNVLVADDGLQHLALARDVEIAVMDSRGVGNGWMMPAGPLREPLGRLARVDALVMNGAAAVPAPNHVPRYEMTLEGARFYNLADPHIERDAHEFKGPVHAVAGIGYPPRFFAHLRGLGLVIIEHAFADHHDFCAADFSFLKNTAQEPEPIVVMTEKDAVKCVGFARYTMWVLRVEAHLSPDLMPRILELINGRKTA
jgi:tetraacyldisaccharide 4'-kinase